MKNIYSIFFFLFFTFTVSAQDTLTFMYYNILNYSVTNYSNTHDLKRIIQYIRPDVFAINEISSDTSSQHILNYVMNADSVSSYKKADFTDGPDTDNMLFYNSDKLSLYSQDTIQTDLRIINEYLLYYNNSVYINLHDTVFFYVYIAHLKANSGTENELSRYQEILRFKSHLNEIPNRKNIFFGGDFNFYDSTEPGFVELLSHGNYQMNDPLDSIGNWHDNSFYAHLHTQSTRNRQFGGGATGGLDDRFDFILVSNDLIQGSHQLRYIQGTYKAFGNDGNHLNDSITALPLAPCIPNSITYCLYNMSDHLPVIMKTYLNFDASIHPIGNNIDDEPFRLFPNPSSGNIIFSVDKENLCKGELEIFSSDCQFHKTFYLEPGKNSRQLFSLDNLKSGVYFARIIICEKVFIKKIVIIR